MSKLPQPPAPVRGFEYVNDDDAALVRARLQQHFGAAGVHAFGHVVGGVRALCERSLLPPLTVLNELLAKISPNSRLPDIIARVRSLAAPLPATSVRAAHGQGNNEVTRLQVSFHQAVRLHVIKTLPLSPAPLLPDAPPPLRRAAALPAQPAGDAALPRPGAAQVQHVREKRLPFIDKPTHRSSTIR
jgi:hypothetical protein